MRLTRGSCARSPSDTTATSEPTVSNSELKAPGLPPGTPAWVTEELLENTLDTWQPYYEYALTPHDALEILFSVTELFDRLGVSAE